MKHLILLLTASVMGFANQGLNAQPVAKADAIALLVTLPAPPTDLAGAYQRAYPNATTKADAKLYYQTTIDKLVHVQQEAQNLLLQFYQQNPMGVPSMPQQPTNRVSAKDKSAIEAASSELAQKMMTDKAFAQKFAQMSESEQHAYIAKMLADKGLKPSTGAPNTHDAPIPGIDIDWITLGNEFTQPVFAMHRWEEQVALEQQYNAKHDAVNTWIEAEIKKLPMISFGEYGHDHDPAKVQAIKKQGLDKHRQVADAMLKEAVVMFAEFRQQARIRSTPLNDALNKVRFGDGYSFGLHYTFVLQTQMMMLGDIQTLLDNEMRFIEEIARWEHDWRNFQ